MTFPDSSRPVSSRQIANGSPQRRTTLGIACLIGATFVFASMDAVTKHLVSQYPVAFIVMVRFWVFGAYAWMLAARRTGQGPLTPVVRLARSRRPMIQTARGVILVAETGFMAIAFRHLQLAEVQAVFAIYPLLIMVLAVALLGERVGWRRWVATGVAFAGLLIILRPGLAAFQPAALLALAGAFCYGLYQVLTRLVSPGGRVGTDPDQGDDAATTILFTALAGAAAVTTIGLVQWPPTMAAADWGWLALLCGLGILANVLLIQALALAPASVLQPFNYLMLVWSVGVGFVVFGDIPDAWTLVGAGVIVASGLYALARARKDAPAENRTESA